jgi:hypothetical protein
MHKGNVNVAFALGFFAGIIAVCVLFGVVTVAQIAGTINTAQDVAQECGWQDAVDRPSLQECVNQFCLPDKFCGTGSACLRNYKQQCDCCEALYGKVVKG